MISAKKAVAVSPGPDMLSDFSADGAGGGFHFGSGWSGSEPGLRWSVGDHSEIIFDSGWSGAALHDARILAELTAAPYLGENLTYSQRVLVSINGRTIRDFTLNRAGILAFWLPPECTGCGLSLQLYHPGGRAPAESGAQNDQRRLAIAFGAIRFRQIPPPPEHPVLPILSEATAPADLLARFESLGDNCEFGIVQRLSGAEPLALLRFTATPLPSLVNGLLHEFQNLGDPDFVELDTRGEKSEYILTEMRYNLTYHTFVYADQMPYDRLQKREAKKLFLLRRRMMEDLRAARRIYVIKHNQGLADEDVIMLFGLLRGFGPNRLLHVAPCDAAHPAGSVEVILPGLVRGYIDRFAPYDDAADVSLDCWLQICRKTDLLLPHQQTMLDDPP